MPTGSVSAIRRGAAAAALWTLAGAWAARAQSVPIERSPFAEFSLRDFGQPVIPIFDGWYPNADGSRSMCFGYKNLNLEQAIDVPLGPDNFIAPAELGGFQPTHFAPAPESLDRTDPASSYRRQYCVVPIRVPANFQGQVVWTLRANGQTITNPGNLFPAYVIDEPRSSSRGTTAPELTIAGVAGSIAGRNGAIVGPLHARVGTPVPLAVSVEHAGRAWVGWFHHQGPGAIAFDRPESVVSERPGTASTSATFSEPGDYVILLQAIATPADFEFMCCWTNAWIRFRVGES